MPVLGRSKLMPFKQLGCLHIACLTFSGSPICRVTRFGGASAKKFSSAMEENEVRFCAVRWATSLFDFQNCPSRFICMLGAADAKLDIREMALEGPCLLKSDSQTDGLKYAKLDMMLDYVLRQQPKLLESTEVREQNLLFPSSTHVVMIKFLLKCFESELEQNKSLAGSSEFLSSVKTFCLLLEHTMSFEGSVELHVNASKALLLIGSHMPEVLASHYALKVSWLKQLLSHVDWDTRESIACLLGIVSYVLPIPAISDVILELTSLFSQPHKSRFETQHGALCAIGYVTADYLLQIICLENLCQKYCSGKRFDAWLMRLILKLLLWLLLQCKH